MKVKIPEREKKMPKKTKVNSSVEKESKDITESLGMPEDNSDGSNDSPISDIRLPRPDDSAFSVESLDTIAKEREKERQSTGKKRGRKPGSGAGRKSKEEKKRELILPVFMFTNGIMKSRGIEPLTDEEMQTGVDAWFPLIDHYAPKLEKYSMWIAPLAWTTGVVMVRMHGPVKPIEIPEPEAEK